MVGFAKKKGRNHDIFLLCDNVPPQRAMCPLPWEPWEEDYTTGGMPTITLLPHKSPIIFCGQDKCLSQFFATSFAWNKWSVAVRACFEKLEVKRCDYCFKLANEVHR